MVARRNVVLTGFMGTGKSTVGRRLAARLDFEFLDTDTLIEERHGPIATIFAEQGEQAFRSIERAIAAELADRECLVIATGGRLMLDPANVSALSRRGRVYCLTATPEEILERVMADAARVERPLLAVDDPRRRIIELLDERTPAYRRFAQVTTSGRSPDEIAAELASLVESDPQRIPLGPANDRGEFVVGIGLFPLVRELAGIDGPLVVLGDDAALEGFVPSCPSPDLVVTLRSPIASAEVAGYVRERTSNLTGDDTITVLVLGGAPLFAAIADSSITRDGYRIVAGPTDLEAMVRCAEPAAGLTSPPFVVADVITLQTLGPAQVRSDVALMLQSALATGAPLISEIEQRSWPRSGTGFPGQPSSNAQLVAQLARSIVSFAGHGAADERRSSRQLGRPIADAIDSLGSSIGGDALGLGLLATARLSAALGVCNPALPATVEQLVGHVGLETTLSIDFDADDLAGHVEDTVRRLDGQGSLLVLEAIGEPVVVTDLLHQTLVDVLDSLRSDGDS